MNYFKILTFLEKGNKFLFDIPVEEQRAFLDKLGSAKNDVDRSKKQYQCQMFFVPKWKEFLFEIISIVALPCYIFFIGLKSVFLNTSLISKVDCVCENKGMPEVLPQVFTSKYKISFEPWKSGKCLVCKDVVFILKCFVQTWRPYLVFKSAVKISDYSYIIHRYKPRAIQECGEYSFLSSLMTEYCHLYGIKHIDVMHGEKLYYIRDSYFHFDETYVWDKHYIDLFIEMKAEPNQFVVALPPSLEIDLNENEDSSVYADYKYYLVGYTEETLKGIVDSMQFVKKSGRSVKYRIHPRYSDLNLLKKYVDTSEIELPKEVSIQKSIANMGCAVGSYSTVLLQSYFSEKKVLLDDVTYKEQYGKLKELGYILVSKQCKTLSYEQSNSIYCQ